MLKSPNSSMFMTYVLQNSDWFSNIDPYSVTPDMESEIAELRTLTKVTRLRKQIECREEGAWMVVKDVPDDKAASGIRKVTSYGMTKRSVTRSVSSNVDLSGVFGDKISSAEPLVQLPEDSEQVLKPSSVEITEVYEEPLRTDVPEVNKNLLPEKSANRKTSVVTLGKGNLVLIDPEEDETNFHVTGISKGKVANVVSTLEKCSEKKVKKVGFCKTEVHFAPDSGKINIVETDEKPPPTQVYKKKKRSRGVKSRNSGCLPKHYFGEMDDFGDDSNLSNESDKEDSRSQIEHGVFTSVKEKLPTFERTIKSENKDTKYRHSSPEKNEFNIDKLEFEGKEFFKKVKQPSFRDKFLKETNYVPDKIFSESHSSLDDLIKNIDKHPRLKDSLYIYGNAADPKNKVLLKSSCKLSNGDYATISSHQRTNLNHNINAYLKREDDSNSDDLGQSKGSIELGHNLRYAELLKLPSSVEEKIIETEAVTENENLHEVSRHTSIQTNQNSDTNLTQKKINFSDLAFEISRTPLIPVDQDIVPGKSFLGNISPKLQNLIQNSVEHEFQLRQKQILQKRSTDHRLDTTYLGNDKVKAPVTLNVYANNDNREKTIGRNESKTKPAKNVTQVHLSPETKIKHEFQLKRDEITKKLFSEQPDGGSKEIPYLLNEEPVPAPRGKKEIQVKKDASKTPPKPKPRTITSLNTDKSRSPRTPTAHSISRGDSVLSPKKAKSKENISRLKESDRSYSRPSTSKEITKNRKLQNQSQKSETNRVKVSAEVKGKKVTREPLRSFEKVSNGWVGHIVPIKKDGITITTKVYSSKSGIQGLPSSGPRRNSQVSTTLKSSGSQSSRLIGGRVSKNFSLSKEHLSSAKLVKEVTPRKGVNTRRIGGRLERGSSVDSFRRRMRHESERSDDSVVQADEEVRAYMFDGQKSKQRK